MSWVTDIEQAKKLLLQAGTCKLVDNRRVATTMKCMSFDDAGTCTMEFGAVLHWLMQLSSDEICHYVVLDPDPTHYFLHHFKKYPVIEIRSKDTLDQYIASLNEDPGGSRADAIGTNCYEWMIIPQSHLWFAHCVRSSEDSGGHLWLPEKWIAEAKIAYPGLTYPPELAPNTDRTWPG
jgi:hypothetical protein